MTAKIKRVYSENADYQHLDTLKRNRDKRNRHKEFFVEGVKAIDSALHHGWQARMFAYSYEQPLSRWATGILQTSEAEVHLEMPQALVDKLSDKEEDHSELLAVFGMRQSDISGFKPGEQALILVFDRPSNPGNLGTLMRSCEALGVDALVITGHAVDLYDPRTVRASMGALFSIPVFRLESHKELGDWLDSARGALGSTGETGRGSLSLIGTSAKAESLINEVDLTKRVVLVIGNESAGLSYAYKQMCDVLVKIPMYGQVTSLNVACAASIALYEVDRQRRASQT